MIFFLTDLLALQFQTIFGAQIGFEIMTAKDFEPTGIPAKWSIVLNLFAIRVCLTQYYGEDE